MPDVPAVQSYQVLIRTLKNELAAGLLAVQKQRVTTYWHVGRYVNAFLSKQDGPEAAFLENIAMDLDFSLDVVRKIVKFYRTFPNLPVDPPLSWTQYRALLTAPTARRLALEQRAIKEGIGAEQLYVLISEGRKGPALPEPGPEAGILKCERGRLFVYKTLQSKQLGLTEGEIMVDCGFSIQHKVKTSGVRLTGGCFVRSIKTPKGYALRQSNDGNAQLYTYAARVRRTVDADTLLVTVDVGFNIWFDLRARLRGIDAPELSTIAGRRAKQFVAGIFNKNPAVVIKSYKIDKYGRFLLDVFYSRDKNEDPSVTAAKGVFLNQELLDRGLARPYSGA